MICERLHRLFNSLDRHGFPFDATRIPENGVYILFERGEVAHGKLHRIVRVGTHTGQDNLGQRLAEHFLAKNKDRSIFRKNIGRAILNRRNDPFLPQWETDLTTRSVRQRLADQIDHARLGDVEAEVSLVIRESFTFSVVRVDDRDYRLKLEKRMIATVNHCTDCRPSDDWLGNHSPKTQIRESGLWLVQGLNECEMSAEDLGILETTMRQVEQCDGLVR